MRCQELQRRMIHGNRRASAVGEVTDMPNASWRTNVSWRFDLTAVQERCERVVERRQASKRLRDPRLVDMDVLGRSARILMRFPRPRRTIRGSRCSSDLGKVADTANVPQRNDVVLSQEEYERVGDCPSGRLRDLFDRRRRRRGGWHLDPDLYDIGLAWLDSDIAVRKSDAFRSCDIQPKLEPRLCRSLPGRRCHVVERKSPISVRHEGAEIARPGARTSIEDANAETCKPHAGVPIQQSRRCLMRNIAYPLQRMNDRVDAIGQRRGGDLLSNSLSQRHMEVFVRQRGKLFERKRTLIDAPPCIEYFRRKTRLPGKLRRLAEQLQPLRLNFRLTRQKVEILVGQIGQRHALQDRPEPGCEAVVFGSFRPFDG